MKQKKEPKDNKKIQKKRRKRQQNKRKRKGIRKKEKQCNTRICKALPHTYPFEDRRTSSVKQK